VKKIIFRPQALNDMEESLNWYEARLEGLGQRFIKSVDSNLSSIQSNPLKYPKKYRNIRIALVEGFPFVIHFLNEHDCLIIISIYHTSRNPKKFIKRLKN